MSSGIVRLLNVLFLVGGLLWVVQMFFCRGPAGAQQTNLVVQLTPTAQGAPAIQPAIPTDEVGWVYMADCVCDGTCAFRIEGVIPSRVDPCGGGRPWELVEPWRFPEGPYNPEVVWQGRPTALVALMVERDLNSGEFLRLMDQP